MPTIRELPVGSVYQRKKKGVYLKINQDFHVKVRPSRDRKNWLGDGAAEKIEEEVQIIQRS